jgi:hypothetical protein
MSVIVYGVNNGEQYSDYAMLAFFSTRDKAKAWIAERLAWQKERYPGKRENSIYYSAQWYEIEDWPVDKEDTCDE